MNELMDDNKKNSNTGCLVFPDGQYFWGNGFGLEGIRIAEICFNTAMTGYQEILTDLSYAGQIVNFTFPHIGNTGTNEVDNESKSPAAVGLITRSIPTASSHWRAKSSLELWLRKNKLIGIGDVDTRRITRHIRHVGANPVAICHKKSGDIDLDDLKILAKNAHGLQGKELTATVTCQSSFYWKIKNKYHTNENTKITTKKNKIKIVAIDYGAKWAIFNQLSHFDREVQIVPASVSFQEILNLKPDGIFLSNGPGDPLATFKEFGQTIVELLNKTQIPIFGICLGHQLLGLAAGAKTIKMMYGHHGANHPVLNLQSGKVEITSMNHGFAISNDSLPENVVESHTSLFDKSNCGIEILNRNCFSIQHHPEASPGPQDSSYLFEKFYSNIRSSTSV